MSKQNLELKNMSSQELASIVDEARRELFSLRLHSATNGVKDHTQFKKLRKKIARALTFHNENDQKANKK